MPNSTNHKLHVKVKKKKNPTGEREREREKERKSLEKRKKDVSRQWVCCLIAKKSIIEETPKRTRIHTTHKHKIF